MAKPFGGRGRINMTALPMNNAALEEIVFAESVLNKGMNTTIDAADLDLAELTNAKNVRVRYDKTSRRPGKSTFGGTKPDSNQVMKLLAVKIASDLIVYLRVSPTSVTYYNGSTWTTLTGSTIAGTELDFIQVGLAENTFFLTNNGVDPIKKLDFIANSINDLYTGALNFKTATSFLERIVGANIGNSLTDQVTLAWSGNRAYTEFDPLVDESAGTSPLVANPRDLSDPISLLLGFTSTMVIFRENSIWLATPTYIDTQPFQFFPRAPGYGAVPSTVAIGGGEASGKLCFYDERKRSVFAWSPDAQPERLGGKIETTFLSGVDDKRNFFGEYLQATDEYVLGTKIAGSNTRKLWIYNFRTGSYCYDEIDSVSSISELYGQLDYTSIDELTGTIDALAGTINGLSTTIQLPSAVVYGYTNGDLLQEDATADTDNGTAYTTELKSKEFKITKNDVIVSQLRFEYIPSKAGTFLIQYTKDAGGTWTTAKTITFTATNKKELCTFKKALKARRLMWRITATSGIFDVINYEVIAYASGESKQST